MGRHKKITTIPIQLLNIEGEGFHLLIESFINGKAARILVDTGASKTVVDKKRINNFVAVPELKLSEQLSTGLGTNTMESHTTIIDQLQIGTLLIKNYRTYIIDISHVNTSYERLKLEPIDGVLGSDIMLQYRAVVDYGKKILMLSE